MSTLKTINLLVHPLNGTRELRMHVPSLLATALLAAVMLAGAILFMPKDRDPRAHAEESSAAARAERLCRVPAGDPAAYALLRADGWVPWDRLLGELPAAAVEIARIDELEFDGDRRVLHLAGTTWDVNELPRLMLFFSKFPWLRDPVPVKIQQDLKNGTASFLLQIQIVPGLQLEQPKEARP